MSENQKSSKLVELSTETLQAVRGGAGEDGYSSCVANVGDSGACRELAFYEATGGSFVMWALFYWR